MFDGQICVDREIRPTDLWPRDLWSRDLWPRDSWPKGFTNGEIDMPVFQLSPYAIFVLII